MGCLRGVLGASWRRFGTVWSGSWVPTWVPTWSQLGQKIDPKIDHFWDASWDLFLDGFLWILGAQMEPSWHQNGIKNRCLLGRAIFQNSCSGCSAGGPQRVPHNRLTPVPFLFTWKLSPLQSSKLSFEYLLLPPRSALEVVSPRLTPQAAPQPPRPPTH